jgi:hypothetical protein
VAKNTNVSLVLYCPIDEHCERGQGLSIGVMHVGSFVPPLRNGPLQIPRCGVHMHKTELLDDQVPESNGDANQRETCWDTAIIGL